MKPGDALLLRSVYGGRARWAFSWRVVEDDGEVLVTYLCPGTPGVWMGRDADGRYLERWMRGDPPRPHVWRQNHVLSLSRRGDAHSLWLFWGEDWVFRGWYVQLHSPLVETPLGYDVTDHALDVIVYPDRTWRWKDEDGLIEALQLGALTDDQAATIRAEGERVIAALPWPTGWEDWRPPADWTPPPLPSRWDEVDPGK